jgi:hypothetical protein
MREVRNRRLVDLNSRKSIGQSKAWEKRRPATIEAYLDSKCEKKENGCWESKNCREGKYKEGQYNGEEFLLHIKSYEVHNGLVPKGLIVRHKCDNTKCINPEHLEVGTKKDNRQDFLRRHPKAKELIAELVEKGTEAIKGFWDSIDEGERKDFVKRRAEKQAQIRRERLAKCE